jgi:hypothetical protein
VQGHELSSPEQTKSYCSSWFETEVWLSLLRYELSVTFIISSLLKALHRRDRTHSISISSQDSIPSLPYHSLNHSRDLQIWSSFKCAVDPFLQTRSLQELMLMVCQKLAAGWWWSLEGCRFWVVQAAWAESAQRRFISHDRGDRNLWVPTTICNVEVATS